ncbi:sulfatase-like hydrolase/transferase [Thalassotalea piscium]
MKLKVHIFILSHALLALLAMLLYAQTTTLSITVIVIHPLVVCAIYTTLLYCIPRKFRILSVSILTTLLILLYLSNIVAAHYWNGVITWSFLRSNLSVIIAELQKFPIYVFLIFFGGVMLLVKIYRKSLSFQENFRQHFGVLLLTPILVSAFYYSIYEMQEDMSATLQGEPLFEFLNVKQRGATTEQNIIIPKLTLEQTAKLGVKKQPNIILIHGDALRADRLGAYGNPRKTTPFIDNLIYTSAALKISNGLSNCSETICGVASVTASNFSYVGNVENIFTTLRENGYVNNFIGTGDLYHGGLDKYLSPITDNFIRADLNDGYYKHDDKFVLDTLELYPRSSERPQLFYLRMMSSHQLGSHQQKYKQYQPLPNSLFSMPLLGGNSFKTQVNAHDNFAIQFDAYVNNIFSIMSEKGYLDNAIVVIFGDHGDAMGERGYNGHYQNLYQEEIKVPIVIWTSNNIDIGIKNIAFATLMDIPATLLHYLDIPIPKNFLGSPLQIEQREKIAYLDSKRDTVGLLYQRAGHLYKLLLSKNEQNDSHLFELTSDPKEHIDIYEQDKEFTARLINTYNKFTGRKFSN